MRLVHDGLQLLLVRDPSEPPPSYGFAVRTARRYLRCRDFLHYYSQMIPRRRESETWSLAWAYIRDIDDVIDSPKLTSEAQLRILRGEWQAVEEAMNGRLLPPHRAPLRHLWLKYLFENLRAHYEPEERRRALEIIRNLYLSALMDAARRGRILTREEMLRLLWLKAVCFFKLYFLLARLRLERYADQIAEALGLALGMLDDLVDFLQDWRSGYINVTVEDLRELGIEPDMSDELVRRLIERGYFHAKGLEILRLLMRARLLAYRLRDCLARKLVLRLTEIFAAPVLEGRLVPGARYFFKGGRLLMRLLPRDEMLAYEIGHRFAAIILSIPQLSPLLIKLWTRLCCEPPRE